MSVEIKIEAEEQYISLCELNGVKLLAAGDTYIVEYEALGHRRQHVFFSYPAAEASWCHHVDEVDHR